MRIFLFVLILASCAHYPKATLLSVITKDPEASIQTFPVKTRSDAKRIIQNRHNYLRILFEQSVDPYYGKPKWSEECLKANRIGSIKEDKHSVILWSELVIKDNKEGYCPGEKDSKTANVLLVFCEGDDKVQEFKFSSNLNFNPHGTLICPKD